MSDKIHVRLSLEVEATLVLNERECAALEAALRPFKVAADLDLKDSHADTDFVAVIVTARELRAARAALTKGE